MRNSKNQFMKVEAFKAGLYCTDEDYADHFERLYTEYVKFYTNDPLKQDKLYVPHDLPHAIRVLDAFCQLIDAPVIADSRFWFIVGSAVFLHDISMRTDSTIRKNHGEVSKSFIETEKSKEDGNSICAIDVDDLFFIETIVNAHTNPAGTETADLFKNIPRYTDNVSYKLYLKQLAGMVRLADELDISRDRTNKYDRKAYHIEMTAVSDHQTDESVIHWDKCVLFERPVIQQLGVSRYSEILLKVDFGAVERSMKEDGQRITFLKIAAVHNKLTSALQELRLFGGLSTQGYCKDIIQVSIALPDSFSQEMLKTYEDIKLESKKESAIADELKQHRYGGDQKKKMK